MAARTATEDAGLFGAGASTDVSDAEVPLILLPGTLCDARLFAPLIACLHGHGVMARDMIVMPLTGARSAHAMARKLLAEAPDRFALLGFSLGGIVALEMAAIAPERIVGLALLATNARADPPANAELRRADVRDGARASTNRLWSRSVAPVNRERDDLRELMLAMAEATSADAFRNQAEIAIARANSLPRLKYLNMPTLVLCGANDVICLPELHREIAGAVPGATLAVLPNAGHLVPIEAPGQVAAHIAKWLDRLPRMAANAASIED